MDGKKLSVKWGILGTANISKRLAPAIKNSKNGKLQAIASRNSEKAKKFSKEFGIPTNYGDYDKLLEDEQVDAIYIPLPNHLHKEWTLKAVKQGKHVLCEKPFALTEKEAKEMFKAGEESNVKIMEAFMYRFNPRIDRIKELMQEGILGDIKYLDFNFSHTLEEKLTRENNYRIRQSEGGGALYDLGVYGINTINYLLDEEPEKILVSKAIKKDDKDIDRVLELLLQYKEKKIAKITASFQSYGNYLMVSGSDGILEATKIVSQGEGELRINTLETPTIQREVTPAFDSYRAMVEHFNTSILENKELLVTKKHTLDTMKVVDEILAKMEKIN